MNCLRRAGIIPPTGDWQILDPVTAGSCSVHESVLSRQVITTVCPKRRTLLLAHHLDPLLRSGPPSLADATGFVNAPSSGVT
jgi:hypothetical protein